VPEGAQTTAEDGYYTDPGVDSRQAARPSICSPTARPRMQGATPAS